MTEGEIINDLVSIVKKYIDVEHPEYTSDDRKDVLTFFDELLEPVDSIECTNYIAQLQIELAGKDAVIKVLREDVAFYKNNWKRVKI